MSPFLHYEIACAHQQEIVRRATNAHRGRTARTTLDRRRSVKHRLIQVLVALGVCVASCTAVTVSDARSAQSPLNSIMLGQAGFILWTMVGFTLKEIQAQRLASSNPVWRPIADFAPVPEVASFAVPELPR